MAALDASQCLIWFDATGRVVDANTNTQALLSYDLVTMRHLTHADLIKEPDAEHPSYQTHWALIRSGAIRNEERSFYTEDGTEIWSSVSYAAVRNDAGETRRVLAIIIDLSPWSWKPKDGYGPLG